MKTSKRILCMLLAIVMTLSMGTVALAETADAPAISFKEPKTLYNGQTGSISIVITPSDYQGTIKWTSSAADVVTVSGTGTTADLTTLKSGTSTITATLMNGETAVASETYELAVLPDTAESIVIKSGSSTVSNTIAIAKAGDGVTLNAIVTLASGAKKTNVKWSTSNATVANPSSTGRISAEGDGEATITATYEDETGEKISASVDVVVGAAGVTAVEIDTDRIPTDLMVGESFTPHADTTPAGLDDLVTWTSSNDKILKYEDGKFVAVAKGKASITASINDKEDAYSVDVKAKALKSVDLSQSTLNVKQGKTGTLTAKVSPEDIAADSYSLEWSSSDPSIATVSANGKSATVTGKASGSALITVTAYVDGVKKTYDQCTVKVAPDSTDISIVLNDADDYMFSSDDTTDEMTAVEIIYDTIGTYSYITFGSVNSFYTENDGKLCYNTGSSSVANSSTKYYRTGSGSSYRYVKNLCFNPDGEGYFVIAYTAYDASGTVVASGSLEIYVPEGSGDEVTVTIDGSETYYFDEDTEEEDDSAYNMLYDCIEDLYEDDYSGDTEDLYIDFYNIVDDDAGVLYDGDDYEVEEGDAYQLYELEDFYFEPDEEGTYELELDIYDDSRMRNSDLIGTVYLFIDVTEGSSAKADGDVVIYLDSDADDYYFDDEDEEGNTAYELIIDYVYEELDIDLEDEGYIQFYKLHDDTAGELFINDDEDELEKEEPYYDTDLDKFYFVVDQDGIYEVEFDVYDDDDDFIDEFFFQIVVGEGGSNGDVSVTLDNTSPYTFSAETKNDDDSVYNMIKEYLADETSTTVSYIKFGAAKGSDVGTLYTSSSCTTKVSSTSPYSISTALKNLTFKPAKTGTFEIPFYAYTSAFATKVTASGTLTIKVPGGSFSTVEEVGDVIVYLDSDADDYYFDDEDEEGNTAYDLIIEYVDEEFDIDLEYDDAYFMFYEVDNDEAGTLYANDDEDDLDDEEEYYDTDLDNFYFVVDGEGSYEVEFDVYLYDDDEEDYEYTESFVLQIIVGDGTTTSTAKSFTTYSSGYTFKTADFYSSLDTSAIVSVVFDKPSSGALYVDYANGSGTAVTSSTKFYTTLSSYGSYAINKLTYIPKAGFSGDAIIKYVGTTVAGKTVTGTITMTVKSKTASSKFSDVTAAHYGSWSANAIDFASSWGLVNGVTTTAPYKFEPEGNMKRCDLLLILYRAAGSPAVTGTITHTDVKSTDYYYKAVVWAVKNGITNGFLTSSYTFGPNTTVTREEFATMLYNYTKYRGISVTNSGSLANYTDASSVSSYAKAAMTWAVSKGYITSMSTTSLVLGAKNLTERAQIATMLHRYLTY